MTDDERKSDPMPEYIDLDADAFEDEWRNWIDNPPVDWAPPEGATRILTQTLDMRERGNFVMRFDAWMGDAGIHVHTRVVMLAVVPGTVIREAWVRKRKRRWMLWRKPEYVLVDREEIVIERRIISKHVVGSFVVPWGAWNMMEDDRLDPDFPKKPNGKGGDPDPTEHFRQKEDGDK